MEVFISVLWALEVVAKVLVGMVVDVVMNVVVVDLVVDVVLELVGWVGGASSAIDDTQLSIRVRQLSGQPARSD